jgi:Serine carboxypeptidase
MISEDAYWFIQKFMSVHPEYATNPLYVVGESYGGHYAPAIAHRIFLYNKKLPSDDAILLNLAGVAVGNGLTAPEVQYAVSSKLSGHHQDSKTFGLLISFFRLPVIFSTILKWHTTTRTASKSFLKLSMRP